MIRYLPLIVTALALTACGTNNTQDVAEINNDWTGNEIKIDAFTDEKVSGVTCHMAYFDRGVYDRLKRALGSKIRSTAQSIVCKQAPSSTPIAGVPLYGDNVTWTGARP